MKVYTKVVIDIRTLKEVETECYDYEGEVALCKGGGGAGKVDWPTHTKAMTTMWGVGSTAFDSLHVAPMKDRLSHDVNLFDAISDAYGSGPWIGATAYSPDTIVTAMAVEATAFETIVDALSDTTDWAALFTQANTTIDTHYTDPTVNAATDIDEDWDESQPGSTAEIEADVAAYEDVTDDRVTTDVLPRFQRGMQDINAVMSSGFTIGQAIIEGMADRDIAKYHGTLRVAAATQKDQIEATNVLEKNKQKATAHLQDDRINALSVSQENEMYMKSIDSMIRLSLGYLDLQHNLSRMIIDNNRVALVVEKEEADQQLTIDDGEARWDLEIFQHGANMIAAGAGGTSLSPGRAGPSKIQSALGGSLAGASAGALMTPANPALGAGIGAAFGVGMGLLGG